MSFRLRLPFALAAALVAAPVWAADPAEEAPVATAPTTAPMSTAEQIDAFIKSSPARAGGDDQSVDGVVPGDDRKVHGEVSVGVGSHGYRSLYARSDMPLGDTGQVSIAVGDARFSGHAGPAYGRAVGAGVAFGAAAQAGVQPCVGPMGMSRAADIAGSADGRCFAPRPSW